MADRISPPSRVALIDETGLATQQFNTWLQIITNRSLIIGEGSPEGAVEALQGAEYMDTVGVSGSIKYIKQFSDIGGNKTLGWVLI